MRLHLFAGDSVTDCGRTFFDPEVAAGHLGDGWVRVVAALLGHRDPEHHRVLNAGVSGDRVGDLAVRWERDVERFAPQTLTVLIGVNDALLAPPTAVDAFADRYAEILGRVPPSVDRLVIAEPFVLPVDDRARALREVTRPLLEVVRSAAAAAGAVLLPLDRLFEEACRQAAPAWWAPDGVHPSAAGHGLIADAWLRAVAEGPGAATRAARA
ncbi:MAG TPA: GDSL-type esterase/lipase family protein [Acidimicrobiales bacterium]|nr:GDSL-type esterase/lipase family protein [Acidimicrobiales bacterium]